MLTAVWYRYQKYRFISIMTELLKDMTNILSQIRSKSFLQIICFMKFTWFKVIVFGKRYSLTQVRQNVKEDRFDLITFCDHFSHNNNQSYYTHYVFHGHNLYILFLSLLQFHCCWIQYIPSGLMEYYYYPNSPSINNTIILSQ